MIVVRNVFHLKWAQSKPARDIWPDGAALLRKGGVGTMRLLVDVTGRFNTMVHESTYNSFEEFEAFEKTLGGTPGWKEWHDKFSPMVDYGYREVFRIVE